MTDNFADENVLILPEMEESQETKENEKDVPVIFDAAAKRTIVLEREFGSRTIEFKHVSRPMDDVSFTELQDIENPRSLAKSGEIKTEADTEKAATTIYKKLAELVENYRSRKTEITLANFTEVVPYEHKISVIRRLTAFNIIEDDAATSGGKEFFIDDDQDIKLLCFIPMNGIEVETTAVFRAKTKTYEKEYKKATSADYKPVRGFRAVSKSLKKDFKALSTLFYSMLVRADGFKNGVVPLYIQIGFVTYLFEEYGMVTEKN